MQPISKEQTIKKNHIQQPKENKKNLQTATKDNHLTTGKGKITKIPNSKDIQKRKIPSPMLTCSRTGPYKILRG